MKRMCVLAANHIFCAWQINCPIYESSKYVEFTCAKACAEVLSKGKKIISASPRRPPKAFPDLFQTPSKAISRSKATWMTRNINFFLLVVNHKNISSRWQPGARISNLVCRLLPQTKKEQKTINKNAMAAWLRNVV